MNPLEPHALPRFVRYSKKNFAFDLLAGGGTDSRPYPQIPGRAVAVSLLLGEVLQTPSLLQLQAETQLPQWQTWTGHGQRISDDTFRYVAARMEPRAWNRGLVWINRRLKKGKALDGSKMHGHWVVSLDANEQFCSDHRCCATCRKRTITRKDAQGRPVERTHYYHQMVYAQLSGPQLSVVLGFEALAQGEEECAAALRLLLRLKAQYGVRFFDVVTVDAWYANGPFLKAAVALGWPVVAVLKQTRYDIYSEALTLTQGPATETVQRDGRQVELWDVRELTFSESYTTPVRVVRVRETWTVREQRGDLWVRVPKTQEWMWVVAGDLDGYPGAVIRDWGHLRWKIENNAFNELTQGWRLTHCAFHDEVGREVLLWIKLIAFTLFHAFAILHGQHLRLAKVTFQEQRKRIYRSLLCDPLTPVFGG